MYLGNLIYNVMYYNHMLVICSHVSWCIRLVILCRHVSWCIRLVILCRGLCIWLVILCRCVSLDHCKYMRNVGAIFLKHRYMTIVLSPHQVWNVLQLCTTLVYFDYFDRYGLEVIRIKGSIRNALSDLKISHPRLKAVCMGTRHTDPHSGELIQYVVTKYHYNQAVWHKSLKSVCVLFYSHR